ncbi:MAG: helix-turn-helix domain-containing protein [Acidimicrobiales bacterium]
MTTLADVDLAFQETLHMPDLGALHAVLATVAANRMDGEPVWLLLIGPPASAKTETVETLVELPEVFTLSTTTKAGLLSGSTANGGTGGALIAAGERFVLVIKDFTTICSEQASTRSEVLAIFRELFDGRVERAVGSGGGRVLKWRGHAGCIACSTEAVDGVDMANFGERWLRYRLPKSSDDDRFLTGIVALENLGRQRDQRVRRTEAVTAFFADLDLPDRPSAGPIEEQDRLIELADLGSRCRSGVVWGGGHGDEIVQVPASEEVPRLLGELGQLSAGLVVIGVTDAERWRLLTKCALDGMATVRRCVLDILMETTVDLTTATVAARCRLPGSSVRRHLQELSALGLCDLNGGHPERWCASGWLRSAWEVVGAPPPTPPPTGAAPNGNSGAVQGTLG